MDTVNDYQRKDGIVSSFLLLQITSDSEPQSSLKSQKCQHAYSIVNYWAVVLHKITILSSTGSGVA